MAQLISPNPRKPGGQPGNHNAIKHGYYARHFRAAEIKDLENITPGLQDEINMIRVFIRRVVAGADPKASKEENLEVLRHISFALQSLTRLVRTHLLIPEKTADDEIRQALDKWLSLVKAPGEEPDPRDDPNYVPEPINDEWSSYIVRPL
jgi:hypothetical protein